MPNYHLLNLPSLKEMCCSFNMHSIIADDTIFLQISISIKLNFWEFDVNELNSYGETLLTAVIKYLHRQRGSGMAIVLLSH